VDVRSAELAMRRRMGFDQGDLEIPAPEFRRREKCRDGGGSASEI
jgi:hypothetical protein